jgi:hypothetical protein
MAEIKCYVYNSNGILTKKGIIDDFISFNFKRSYSNIGEWTLVLDGNSLNAQRVKGMQIISVSDGVAGLVYKCEESRNDNQYTITYTGVELKGIVSQRIIMPIAGSAYQEYTNKKPEYIIAQLIALQVIAPSLAERTVAGTIAPYTEGTENINFSGRFDNVGDAIQTIANTYNVGWYADIQNNVVVWHIYRGKDRRKSQSANSRMIVSYGLDSFGNSTLTNINQLPNVALVAGQGEGIGRATTIVGSGAGLNRSEVYIDARDISDSGELVTRGTETLADYGDSLTYGTTFSTQFIQQYRNPYDLGDIGTIEDSRLATGEVDFRLTEITEVYENGQFRLDATFGYDRQGLSEAIKRSTGNTQSLINTEITEYQPYDADLTSIAGLTGTSGFLKKTAANTWALTNPTTLEGYGITDAIPSSASCNRNWLWQGQTTGQPDWVWGGNNDAGGANCYVWNPSNFNVARSVRADIAESGRMKFLGTFAKDVWITLFDGSRAGVIYVYGSDLGAGVFFMDTISYAVYNGVVVISQKQYGNCATRAYQCLGWPVELKIENNGLGWGWNVYVMTFTPDGE